MSARVRRKRVDGEGVVARGIARRRHDDDGAALPNVRGGVETNPLSVAAQRGGATLSDTLARADTAMRARTIIGLQRVKGNAHVQRLLQREDGLASSPTGSSLAIHQTEHPAVQREPEAVPTLKSVRFKDDKNLQDVRQKKLVLDATKNGGDFVASIRTLQDALIEAKFEIKAGATGFYGPQTTKAVTDFQKSVGLVQDGRVGANTMRELDDTFPPKPDPTPVPPGPVPTPPGPMPIPPGPVPVPPGPVPGPLDLQTVANLDATLVQYQFMLTRQRDALQAVRRDLTNLEKPKAPFVESLVAQFLKSFVEFYFGGAGESLLILITKELEHAKVSSEEGREVLKEANAKLIESLHFPEQVVKAIEDPEDPLATLDEWFDLRLAELTKKGFTLQLAFLHKVKPSLLTQPAADVNEWLKSVATVADSAYQRQYDQELNDWATYQAQAQLKKQTKQGGTDLSGAAEDTGGMLELVLHGLRPEDGFPVDVRSARITGFSARTRRRLAKNTIGALTLVPIAGRGTVVHKGGQRHIDIGRNERGEFFSWNKDPLGDEWLRLRAAARDKPGLEFVTPDDLAKAKAEDGAMGVFGRDLDDKKLSDLEGFLDKA